MHRFVLPVVLLLFPAVASAQNWPQFRGPGQQGHSKATNVPLKWSETENIAWKTPIDGLGWSSPVVKDGRIWLTSALEEGKKLHTICLDLKTGREILNVEVFEKEEPGRVHRKNSHASPTPLLVGDRVYVHFGRYGTACLSTDGKILWKRVLEYNHVHGPGGSPVVYEDKLIINCDGADVQFMIALDCNTGETVWKTKRAHISEARLMGKKSVPMGFSTPLLVKVGDTVQVISTGADHVAGYDVTDGKEIWWSEYDGYSLVPRPVIGHGLVFVCSGYNSPMMYAIKLGGSGNVTESHAAWSLDKGAPLNPSPLVVGNELYLVNDRGVAMCFDAKTGERHWQQRLGGNFSASPLYVDGRIYFLNEVGETTVIAPGTEYKELAKNPLPGKTLASLTPQNGAMLLRTDTHLYRIEGK